MKLRKLILTPIILALSAILLGSTAVTGGATPLPAATWAAWTAPQPVQPCVARTNIAAICVTMQDTNTSHNTQSYLDGDKTRNIPATINVKDPNNPANDYSYTSANQSGLGEIHGRGNFTWNLAKKPYQIKFSEKVNLLGIDSGGKTAKKWVLLANQADPSFMRNAMAFSLGKALGMTESPEYSYADLFINGAYRGNYQVAEKAEVGASRLKLNSDKGVMVELDNNYCSSEPFKAMVMSNCLVLKDVKADAGVPDVYNAALPNGGLDPNVAAGWNEAIAKFQQLNGLLMPPNVNSGSVDWAAVDALIDVDSFVKFYWVNEYAENPEIVKSSINFWYDPAIDTKLHAGPVWDFDSSQQAYVTEHLGGDTGAVYVKNADQLRYDSAVGVLNQWYDRLSRIPQFAQRSNTLFTTKVYPALQTLPGILGSWNATLARSAAANFAMWNVLGTVSPMGYQRTYASTWQGEVNRVAGFLAQRTQYLRSSNGDGMTVLQETGYNSTGWLNPAGSTGQFIGETGRGRKLTAFKLNTLGSTTGSLTGSVYYAGGWHNYTAGVNAGAVSAWPQAGDGSSVIQAVRFSLTGELATTYAVQYRAHISNLGWQSFGQDGVQVGTPGSSSIESLEIRLVYRAAPTWYITMNQSFIKASYNDFLGRAPSAAELSAAANLLWNGTPRDGYLRTLANSAEWLNSIVTKMYQDTLGRAPDAAGLAYWTGLIRNNTLTVAQVASRIYASDEFFQNTGGNTVETWVTQLYQLLLGRAPDAAGLAHWVAQANDPSIGRIGVAYSFYQSSETRALRVQGLYQKLLQRVADATGLPYWTDRLYSMGDIELAISLASSQEYWNNSKIRFP